VNFPLLGKERSTHLDLGSGRNVRNPFGVEFVFGTDITIEKPEFIEGAQLIPVDLTGKLPFEDDYFDTISAFDLLEHIPRWERDANGNIRYPFIDLLSEIHRILKPNGYFTAVTPAVPAPQAFQDPTHINFITEETIKYFIGDYPLATSVGYGFVGNFQKTHQSWLRGSGPFEDLCLRLKPSFRSFSGIRDSVRFVNRSRKLFTFQKSSHLLWILRAVK
jgi:SAM-dependent methyltransferase